MKPDMSYVQQITLTSAAKTGKHSTIWASSYHVMDGKFFKRTRIYRLLCYWNAIY